MTEQKIKRITELLEEGYYVDRCAGCDHWRIYEHIGRGNTNDSILFRCSQCKLVISVTYKELLDNRGEQQSE